MSTALCTTATGFPANTVEANTSTWRKSKRGMTHILPESAEFASYFAPRRSPIRLHPGKHRQG
jgi:hypothetical protein